LEDGHDTAHVKGDNETLTTDGSSLPRRKIVICYFRDHNGEMVVNALLNAGFDVLLFDNGYFKDMVNDPSRYGVKWVIHDREEQRRIQNLDVTDDNNHRQLRDEVPPTQQEPNTSHRLGEIIATRVDKTGPRLIRVMDRSLVVPLMHVADGVASSAGSQLMSECIYSHMPLLALYLERDDEQKLNVALSRHAGQGHKAEVFGTSFETLAVGLKANNSSNFQSPTLEELKRFVQAAKKSRVSETVYRNLDTLGKHNVSSGHEDADYVDEDPIQGPFQGLPDAAAIILEIIKQVVS
jgi:hypothetical protein